MRTNKILQTLNLFFSFLITPVAFVTTFVLSILSALTLNLLLIPVSLVWAVLFWFPLLGLYYVWERVKLVRFLISIVGIPLAFVANVFVSLIPPMGDKKGRVNKLIYTEMFPFTYSFFSELRNDTGGYINYYKELKDIQFQLSRHNPVYKAYFDTLNN
jgi:hypothetical protein